MGATDYLEQYFAINVVFEPLVGELFRSGFIMQAAAAQNDFITPAVVSAAEGDYERNLANTVELFHLLVDDAMHGAHNTRLFNSWLAKHAGLADRRRQHPAADLVAAAGQGGAVHRRAGAGEEPAPRHRQRARPDVPSDLAADPTTIDHNRTAQETKMSARTRQYLQVDEGHAVRGHRFRTNAA